MDNTMLSEFSKWLDKTDFEFNRFNLLADKLEHYLFNIILAQKYVIKNVATKFQDVLSNCDAVNYQDNANIIAYIILPFLNRYRRFHI